MKSNNYSKSSDLPTRTRNILTAAHTLRQGQLYIRNGRLLGFQKGSDEAIKFSIKSKVWPLSKRQIEFAKKLDELTLTEPFYRMNVYDGVPENIELA